LLLFFPSAHQGAARSLALQNQKIIRIEEAASEGDALFDTPERDAFRHNELLVGIKSDVYCQIAPKIQIIHYEARELVFDEHEAGSCLYLIAQGSVKISKKGRAGQQETLAYLMERDFFGEMALIDRGRRSAQAAAVGHAVLGRVDRETWDLLLHLAPHEVLGNFTQSITRRLRSNNQHFIEEMLRNERLSLIGNTISSIVHDMNNPISCILGCCEIMQAKSQDELTAKMTRLIRDSVEKMDTMTRELIDFSRGNTQLKLQALSVDELLQSLEPDFAKCALGIQVRTEVHYHDKICVDRHRLLRVFGNLIRNAREAMRNKDGGVLRFAVERIESRVRFEVADNGCGIPAQILPRIFEPFMTYGKANGTGLGLAISKAVVEAHAGSIAVQSSDRGTMFEIELPAGD
jgi:signal transduction histidine kinase